MAEVGRLPKQKISLLAKMHLITSKKDSGESQLPNWDSFSYLYPFHPPVVRTTSQVSSDASTNLRRHSLYCYKISVESICPKLYKYAGGKQGSLLKTLLLNSFPRDFCISRQEPFLGLITEKARNKWLLSTRKSAENATRVSLCTVHEQRRYCPH